jgi:hypothetical protein
MLRAAGPRFWFKKKLDYQPRSGRPRLAEGIGWEWLAESDKAKERMKETAKTISRKCKYTYGDEYAGEVRANKKMWFQQQAASSNNS